MKNSYFPYVAATVVVSGKKTTFRKANEAATVEAPGVLMRDLIDLCDGTHSIDQVVEVLGKQWDQELLRELLDELSQHQLIIDSREQSSVVWELVKNPPCFPSRMTEAEAKALTQKAQQRHKRQECSGTYIVTKTALSQLLGRRQSQRLFSSKPVTLEKVVNIAWSAYGETGSVITDDEGNKAYHRTIPSAGALYPLAAYICLCRQTGKLAPALYRISAHSPETVDFQLASEDVDRIQRAFFNPQVFDNAHGIMLISGSFLITGEKYGNRSILYVPLEAGHAAQNILLMAAEQDVAAVEVGGFVEELLREAMRLPVDHLPLISVVFGCKAESKEVQSPSSFQIEWAAPIAGKYHPPIAFASVRVSEGRSWSHGRDPSPKMALTKAMAEAREWAACGCIAPGELIRASFTELEAALDPRKIIKYHPAQYRLKGFPFQAFDEQVQYEWTRGQAVDTGSDVRILADLVYFPYYPSTPYYAYANSSGVAAHPNAQTAMETATLELIERDAFMIAYVARLALPTVVEATLPAAIQERVTALQESGFRVWIMDYSLDFAPVILVFAQNDELAYTTCAACSSFDVEHAVSHALMEVEASVLARLQNGPVQPLHPREVSMPLDHGKLYGQRRYYRRANFLVDGQAVISFREAGKSVARNWQQLMERFAVKRMKLYTVPLQLSDKYGGNTDLHIVRSIAPGLVPMTFGYRQEPADMKRIYSVSQEFGNRSLSYRELTRFPHPFE